jgi:leucyl-tRNA synthetase
MTQTQSSPERYDPAAVEARWQRRWRERQTNATDLSGAVRPYYNLMMFPYPSAEGLHVGNVFAFVGADVHGRFRRLQGWDVFEPIGFDAFGIHSENYALKVNTHPAELIPRNIARFREQLTRVGLMLDWDHEVQTTDPRYYKWTQWIFLKLFEAGLAVKKKAPVNWCPECKTVLANEQVIDGRCERHPDTPVTQRFLEQWFFRITAFTERLLENLQRIDWSESTRLMQTNWIGRSEGAELVFRTEYGTPIEVFTTRPDTVFGATYMVLAPEHPLVQVLTTDERREEVDAYRRRAAAMDVVTRRVGEKEKTGVFTGATCRNPATGEQVPVWIADYVLMEYGTGAIMAVPAHDERDYAFALTFGLQIRQVVEPPAGTPVDAPAPRPDVPPLYTGWEGTLVNSERFDGMTPTDAVPAITEWLESQGAGKKRVQHRLHDWCISRQRYWGPPIPIIYCAHCGTARPQRGLVPSAVPDVRGRCPSRDGRLGYLPRFGVVLPALPVQRLRRSPVRSDADRQVAAGGFLHRRERARRPALDVLPFHHDGAARSRPPGVRGAVHALPGARDDRQRRRQDVEVAGQRRHSRRVHRSVGRGHVPHVSHVPRPVPGGW